jgi:hypothetical protein
LQSGGFFRITHHGDFSACSTRNTSGNLLKPPRLILCILLQYDWIEKLASILPEFKRRHIALSFFFSSFFDLTAIILRFATHSQISSGW